jgi:hypothetical protein
MTAGAAALHTDERAIRMNEGRGERVRQKNEFFCVRNESYFV